MAIPRTTWVMALVACVPFALAIRATVNGRDARTNVQILERHELDAEAAPPAVDERRQQHARDTMFGGAIASLGGRLAEIRVGGTRDEVTDEELRQYEEIARDAGAELELVWRPDLLRIVIRGLQDDDTFCLWVEDELPRRWGPARSGSWWDANRRMRVHYEGEDCELNITRAVTPADWYGPTKASVVPAWFVGKPAEELLAAIGEGRYQISKQDGYDLVSWDGPGLAWGKYGTMFVAYVVRGEVAVIYANLDVADEPRALLLAHLTELHGPPSGGLTWKTSPPIAVDDAGTLQLRVGTDPFERADDL